MNDKSTNTSGPEARPATAAPTNPAGGERQSGSLVSGVILALLVTMSGLQGIYTYRLSNRLTDAESALQSNLASQGETIQKLAQRFEESELRTGGLQQEVASTKKTIGATQTEIRRAKQMASQLAEQQKQSAELLAGQLSQLAQEQVSTQGTVGSLSTDISGVKQDVSLTKNQLEATRTELQRVIGDLGVQSDLIAHNRDELAELRVRGERDYFEFDLRRTKQPQRVGNVSLHLKKTDVKRQKYTVSLFADDRTIEKKDKTANEPVQFYEEGFRQPTEIVVNQIYKDRIVGYVSVPKKKEVRTNAMALSPESARAGF